MFFLVNRWGFPFHYPPNENYLTDHFLATPNASVEFCRPMSNTEQFHDPRSFAHLCRLPELIMGHKLKVNHQSSLIIHSTDVCTFLQFHLHYRVAKRKSQRMCHMRLCVAVRLLWTLHRSEKNCSPGWNPQCPQGFSSGHFRLNHEAQAEQPRAKARFNSFCLRSWCSCTWALSTALEPCPVRHLALHLRTLEKQNSPFLLNGFPLLPLAARS